MIIENIQSHFNDLSFIEDTHTYYLQGKPLKGSVSSLLKDFYEPFPQEDAVAKTMARTGRSKEDILQEWKENNDESKDRGHRVHLFGENYAVNKILVPSCPQEKAMKKFWDELPEWIIPVGMEVRMYHKLYSFPGTTDLVLYDTRRQGYIIADYKTNKDLFKNYKQKKMLEPFSHLLDCPYSHYKIQLSLYQIMLEQLGIKVIERKIIYLNFEGEYVMYNTEDLTLILNKYLKTIYNGDM